jgi:hypothetical protein
MKNCPVSTSFGKNIKIRNPYFFILGVLESHATVPVFSWFYTKTTKHAHLQHFKQAFLST